MDFTILDGVAQGFNQGVQNLVRIKEAGMRLKQEREQFDLDKKIGTLKIRKLESELDPDILARTKTLFKKEAEYKEKELDYKQAVLDENFTLRKMDLEERIENANRLVIATEAQGIKLNYKIKADGTMEYSTGGEDDSDIEINKAALKNSYSETGEFLGPEVFEQNRALLSRKRRTQMGSAQPTASGAVRMISPAGKPLKVPEQYVQAALANGATYAKE